MTTFLKLIFLKIKEWLYNQYIGFRTRFTRTYWQLKFAQIKQFKWRNIKTRDLRFVLKGAISLCLFCAVVGLIFYLSVNLGLWGRMPSSKDLKAHQNFTASEVYSSDSVLIGRYYLQDRTNVKYENISPDVIKALVATEDARFYKHSGVDPRSLFRVMIKSLLLQKESSGGGSTISQQLAKNLYPRRDYGFFTTPVNKLQEMIIARRLERVYNKKEILELYLNTVPLGGNLFGIERASWRFFNKPAKALRTEEAAVLIGMLKATTTYNPRLHPDKSKERRNVVLNQMLKYNYLSANKIKALKDVPLVIDYKYTTHNEGVAPYFREQLRLELDKWCTTQKKANGDPYNLYTDGLKIYTTLNAAMQIHAEKAVTRRMTGLQKEFDEHWRGKAPWIKDDRVIKNAMVQSDRYKKLKEAGKSEVEIEQIFKQPVQMQISNWRGTTTKNMSPLDSLRYYMRFLNTGLLAMEPKTGYIRVWVGGIHHKLFKYDHVRSKRQVGSTFKPIVYAAALEKGIEPCTYFPNKLNTYPEYENWSPHNSDGQYGGKYSMRGALAHSVNTISAQLLLQTGIEPTIELAKNMGIESSLPKVPALALGTADISLFEMVNAYSTFANDGNSVAPVYITKIVNQQGKVIRQYIPEPHHHVLSSQNAAIMLSLMQGVVEEGSGQRLRSEFGLSMDIAGKTGTTQDQTDGWFIGITPDLVTGVWVGGENPLVRFRTLALGQGAHTALPVWGEFMLRLTKDPKFKDLKNRHFPSLAPELSERLACNSFIEDEPEKKDNFFNRLFDDIFSSQDNDQEERHLDKEQKAREREERWQAHRRDRDRRIAKDKPKRKRFLFF